MSYSLLSKNLILFHPIIWIIRSSDTSHFKHNVKFTYYAFVGISGLAVANTVSILQYSQFCHAWNYTLNFTL